MQLLLKSLLMLIFVFPQAYIFSQPEEKLADLATTIAKINIHEIDYQFPFMLGYSYFRNYENKFIPGIGFKIGVGAAVGVNSYYCRSKYIVNGDFLLEFLEVDLKARDLFAKHKLSRWNGYDIGINYTAMLLGDYEWYQYLNLKLLFYIKIIKVIRFGITMKVGHDISSKYSDYYLFFSPGIIISL